jgi:MutS domain V
VRVPLLFADDDIDVGTGPVPSEKSLVQDLELDRIYSAMSRGDQFIDTVVRQVVPRGLSSPTAIGYRQAVLRDFVTNTTLAAELYALCVRSVEERKANWGIWGRSSRNPTTILSGSVRELEMYVVILKDLKAVADEYADKVRSDGVRNLFASLHDNLTEEYFATIEEHLHRLRFRDGVLMSAVLGPDNSGRDFVLRRSVASKLTWRQRLGLGPKDGYSYTVPSRDEGAAQSLESLRARGVNLVANAVAQSSDHVESYFAALRTQLAFYLGCLNLRRALSTRGAPLYLPEPCASVPVVLDATDLRDASLVLQTDGPVFGNEVHADGKSLIIVTGANSGGKSTFLRSVGLAQVLMQCGCFVTARSYRASVSKGVFSHFIREEDASMKRGRLDDELSRMSLVVDDIGSGALLLCNESFASTNEREGSEIARQVVGAMLDAGVRVIFVTHQYDFAESFVHSPARSSTLFLAAQRETDGVRTFQVTEREPEPTSYGTDLYAKVFADA